MIATVTHAFPLLIFAVFYVLVVAISLAFDRMFRGKAMLGSLALSLVCGMAMLWFCQYWSYGWSCFTRIPKTAVEAYRYSGEWSAMLDILLWYGLPLYMASLAIRFARKRSSRGAPGGNAERG
jgi:hypothetical protein